MAMRGVASIRRGLRPYREELNRFAKLIIAPATAGPVPLGRLQALRLYTAQRAILAGLRTRDIDPAADVAWLAGRAPDVPFPLDRLDAEALWCDIYALDGRGGAR